MTETNKAFDQLRSKTQETIEAAVVPGVTVQEAAEALRKMVESMPPEYWEELEQVLERRKGKRWQAR